MEFKYHIINIWYAERMLDMIKSFALDTVLEYPDARTNQGSAREDIRTPPRTSTSSPPPSKGAHVPGVHVVKPLPMILWVVSPRAHAAIVRAAREQCELLVPVGRIRRVHVPVQALHETPSAERPDIHPPVVRAAYD